MKQLNLSEWALRHQQMVLYLMIVLMVGGVLAFFKLGRAEDPDFTFKVMVVRTLWPGASASQVEQQLTERIEKKLAETPWVDVLRTASKPTTSASHRRRTPRPSPRARTPLRSGRCTTCPTSSRPSR